MAIALPRNPVAKMSIVWKYFKLKSKNSPPATCSICDTTTWQGHSSRAAFNKHAVEYNDFTTATEETAATLRQPTLRGKMNADGRAIRPKKSEKQ